MSKALEHIAKVEVKTRSDLREWLENNHLQKTGIWLVTYKKVHKCYLPYQDIVQECLCFGWIDSLPKKLDETRTMLYISPRKKGSNWSGVNKTHIEKLQNLGLIQPAGLKKIEQAKKDGSWTFLDDVEALIVPEDLQLALAQNKTALKNWNAFPPSVKRGILEWIKNAKRSETRIKRIHNTVDKAVQNVRANY
ncbi:YdeI/OmpD-associated family protein [Waterburya agarophytonicola K14]|uniref:YdeI/OmpD-associated family protein n=1 Tax=Waterburya agarophytonicola KI4 TaxID=2874699 RepID=A0A964BQK7_9CYAN|nr:YdeI/OmpD-associated family protein [Waterburya agarophytonicola]MCC0177769.1 YdeI/OmpD-associated family protein [Waterburya agarophytonicola KI4]